MKMKIVQKIKKIPEVPKINTLSSNDKIIHINNLSCISQLAKFKLKCTWFLTNVSL